jgi:hypothetical protein
MEEYSVNGCPVWYGFFNTFDERDEKEMRKTITTKKNAVGLHEITIYPYPEFGDEYNDESDTKVMSYYKKHTSSKEFTVGRVLSLIHEAFMCAVDEIFEGNDLYLKDMSISGFKYDPKTSTVYPTTES